MESRVFDCVSKDDVEGLKLLLMHYPNFFHIEDDEGSTILQRAMRKGSFEVFNFLLSLGNYPINARNSKGETAIQYALDYCGRHVDDAIGPLLENGAEIDWRNCRESEGLEGIILRDRLDLIQSLIEKGWDLNYQNSITGQTPFHLMHRVADQNEDCVAMLLYFGADPLIPDFEGFTPIDDVFECVRLSESMLEHLIFYIFDDYYSGYDIPIDSLFGLLQLESPLVPHMLKHITPINVNVEGCWYYDYFQQIFIMKPEYLKLLLEKFDYVIEAILDASFELDFIKHSFFLEISIENCDLLLQSQFSSDVIQIINQKIPISNLISHPEFFNKPHSEIFDLILFLLSYGVNICDSDLEVIYKRFGDCELFRMLLHMDIKINEFQPCKNDIMPGLLYNVYFMDIETFLSDPNKYKCSANAVKQLLNYFAHPKLQDFCWRWPIECEDIHAMLDELPTVPLLMDLARNAVRKFLIEKFKIKNSMQFYTLIKHLPISKVHQKIITLETKLY